MYARIENETVMEILDVEKLPDFHPSLVWVECDPTVKEGHIYKGGKFTEPPKPEPEKKEPSEIEVRLLALEKKAQITEADKKAARTELNERR